MRSSISRIGGPTVLLAALTTMVSAVCGAPPENAAKPASSSDVESPDAIRQRIAQLVDQLGAAAFREREAAGRELLEIGVAALPALSRAVDDPDLEVQFRAVQLVRRLRAVEQRQILEAFKSDPESPPGNRLQGWSTLKSITGDSPAARSMLISMHESEAALFAAWQAMDDEKPETSRLSQVYEQRCNDLKLASTSRGRKEVDLASIGALLLIGGLDESTPSSQTIGMLTNLLNYSNVRVALNENKPHSQILRNLLSEWIRKPGGTVESYQKLLLAMRYSIPAGREPAIRLIEAGGAGSQLQYAILALGKLGQNDDIEYLVPLFKNKTVLSQATTRNRTTYFCKVCDVALAAAVHLTGQKTAAYEFERLTKNQTYLFAPNSAGFASEEQRAAAFAKWRQWQRQSETAAAEP